MNLTQEQRDQVASEVKRFASDLQLSPEQQEKLQAALQAARGKVDDYKAQHPGATRADIVKEITNHRDQIRQRVVAFLTPEQLKKWDAEVAKAKQFLGQQIAA